MRTRAPLLAALVAALAGSAAAQGDATRGEAVYQKFCSQCHGASGMADGPAAQFVYPRPRKLAENPTYKFKSTAGGELPTDQDLVDIVTRGIPGTSMPSFSQLGDQERRDVVAHVKSLTSDFTDPAFTATAVTMPEIADAKPLPSSPESIQRGAEVYEKNQCWKCHGQKGRGDGESWKDLPKDSWGDLTWPANLANPEHFRNGHDPKDIFRTVTTGISGTPMPAYVDSISVEDRWHLVNYVLSFGPGKLAEQEDVVVAVLRETLPEAPDDPAWSEIPPSRYGTVPNVIEPPRSYWSSVKYVMVRAFYNQDAVALQVQWDDRSESKGTNRTQQYEDRDGKIYKGTDHPDQLAIQFPARNDDPKKRPYFLFGDNKRAVNLWWWTGDDGKLVEVNAKSYGAFTPQPQESQDVTGTVTHADGRYTMVVRRSLTTADARGDIQLSPGGFAPIAFHVWDGDSGEVGQRRGLTTWYWLYLEEPVPKQEHAMKAAGVGIFTLALLGLIVVRTRKKARPE